MIEFLSDNLFIVIAVVIFIVLRVINSRRKKAAASREDEAAEESSTIDDEDDDDRAISLGHWEIEKESQPTPVPQPAFTRKTLEEAQPSFTSLSKEPVFSFSADKAPVTAEVSSQENKAAKPSTFVSADLSQGTKASGLSGLDHLPTLKKAFVFSEILSPPKALR
jgi:FtsZ-interacting cell division protein ZipA